ncbi:hypothetical protein [Sedimenticola sp.]|uniref:hypothetical protein n=1 Tax=Sedimenticola sp. TaxID=1940285 RepID=UPI003D09BB73
MRIDLPFSAVEPFVRECLGCGCPASVFDDIESDIKVLSGIRYQRLLAGQRLLVYLLRDVTPEQLICLQQAGLAERDTAGYNRLRIVLVGEPDGALYRQLREQFEQNASGDEKVHLHFVSSKTLAGYLIKKGKLQ